MELNYFEVSRFFNVSDDYDHVDDDIYDYVDIDDEFVVDDIHVDDDDLGTVKGVLQFSGHFLLLFRRGLN